MSQLRVFGFYAKRQHGNGQAVQTWKLDDPGRIVGNGVGKLCIQSSVLIRITAKFI